MTVAELKRKREAALKRARAIGDVAQKAGREFTAQEKTEVVALLDEAKAYRDRIEAGQSDLEKADDDLRQQIKNLEDTIAPGPARPGSITGAKSAPGTWAQKVLETGFQGKALIPNGVAVPPAAFDPEIHSISERPTFIRSLIPSESLEGTDRFSYMRQTVRDNNAAPVAPGDLKPTSIYTVELVEDRARTIAHVSEPLKRQQLSDAAFLQQFIEEELRLGLVLEADNQILNGDGVGENFEGIFNVPGVQVQQFAGGTPFETSRFAVTKLENFNLRADAWVMSPEDWEWIELQTDANDRYYNPNTPVDRLSKRLWGIPVVTSTSLDEGVAILGSFAQSSKIWDREEPEITWSENVYDPNALGEGVGATDFQRNLIRFRAEERLGFGVLRPAGFVLVEFVETPGL